MNLAAIEVAELLEHLVAGYFTHDAAMYVARHPRAVELAPAIEPGQHVPIGRARHKGSEGHQYHFLHYLAEAKNNPVVEGELSRAWLYGALLISGDALGRHNYFDRAPELELIRHLRNGIAHGNRFRIDNSAALARWPAHNKPYAEKSKWQVIEIQPELNGSPVLFDFVEAGDVVSIIQFSGMYLRNWANDNPNLR